MKNKKKFAATLAVASCLTVPFSVSEARIYTGLSRPYFSSFWNRGANWLMSPSFFNHSKEKENTLPIDEDEYLDSGKIRMTAQRNDGRNKMNEGVEDMRKRQSDMQDEMKKQRQEMEKQFEKLNQKKQEEPKNTLPQTSSEQPKMELPSLPNFETRTMPEMKPLQTPQQQALPDTPALPKIDQPSLDGSFANSAQNGAQANSNNQTVHQTPEREPAKIIIEDDQKQRQTFREEENQSSEIKISTKTILVALAVLFLIMGIIFFLSR